MILDRKRRDDRQHDECANAGRRAQQAKPLFTNFQYVPRIDRQQRHGAAQQHSEQIQRDRAQHNFLIEHIFEPAQQHVECRWFALDTLGRFRDRENQDGRYGKQADSRSIRKPRPDTI